LGHHDAGRLERGDTGRHEVQQDVWVWIERRAAEQAIETDSDLLTRRTATLFPRIRAARTNHRSGG
jgi:hypothetical protein